ncbi:MAG: VWA domain-containing protein [Deltaproteobacteria bacterium]|nr:VWA domain-containing protein [Deltaproteobacteria bacterium]
MQWGAPYAFFLLLGAIPLIVLLHSLRPKGNRLRTTTLFLLERILQEQPVGKRLGWLLKKNLLLLLQILIALILIAALANPSLLGYGQRAGDTVVVMDASASMKAKGPAGSRFRAARGELLSLINSQPSGQRMMVIEAGPTPQVLLPFTSDRKKMRALARSLRATDTPAKVKEAILFAHSFLRQESGDQVVVISDGAFEGIEDLPWQSPSLRLVRVTGGSENVAITGFEFRRVPAKRGEYEIMVSIRNFTSRPIRAPLTVMVGEENPVREDIEIGAEGRRVFIYPYRGPLKERATALLAVDDDFLTDNRAFLALSESPLLRVLYAGKKNLFLEHLFRSFPQVRVTRTDQLDSESLAQQIKQYDVIVLNGIESPRLVEGNFILINTVGEGIPLKVAGKVVRPRTVPWAESHPLAEGLRLDQLYVSEALRLVPLGEGVTLARSEETPLIYALETDRLRTLVFGFDLLHSDLPFRVSFPILFGNAFAWFRPGKAEFPAVQVQAGTSHTLRLKEVYGQVEVRTPSRQEETLEQTSRTLVFPNTFEVGFYNFKAGESEGQFAVNLFSESESQIRATFTVPPVARTEAVNIGRTQRGMSLWPYLLAFVLFLLLAEGFIVFRGGGSFYPLLVRIPALLAVIGALVNPNLFFKVIDELDVILAVDYSRSVGQQAKEVALPILDEAQRLKGPKTRVGLLTFAHHPAWEFFPRGDFPQFDFSPAGGREQTNIAAALQAAHAQLGGDREGRILLVSDGNENRGKVSTLIPLLRSHGVQVWAYPVSFFQGRNEVYVKDLVLPHRVDSAETFEVRGAIESLRDATVRIQLMRDGVIRRETEVTLKPGTNWISFREVLRERGNHTLELLVESRQDTLAENNLLQGVIEVKGPPRILYLHSPENTQRFMARALKVQGYEVVETSGLRARLSLPELSAFDLLVLDNLPAYRLSQAKMEVIENYVKNLGGGLIVIGGPKSYGAGGYYRTPLERVLPVDMRPPARLELPQVALLFVLDKSGSMSEGERGATKLDLAKAAAIASAELLNPSDEVGILAFDAEWQWVIPFTRVERGEWIAERIASLQSDGGTDLYKAMVEAQRAFSGKEAAIKHVLVLSDGLTDKSDFRALVKKLADESTTVSTVSVGSDADHALMAQIARIGKGRGYATIDPRTIPQIFTTETLLISQDLLVEKVVQPKVIQGSGPMRGLSPNEIPAVQGYVLTHPKPIAEIHMKVGDDPLLISWRYGLGRVVAFTSDLTGRWGRDWVKWEDFPRWVSQLARSAMKRVSENRVQTEFRQEGEEIRTQVDFFSADGRFMNQLRPKGILTGPEKTSQERSFYQVAPGRYETRFTAPKSGTYFLTIFEQGEKGDAASVATTVPYVAPYSKEYREVRPNTTLLSHLAEQTGGEILRPESLREGLERLFTPRKTSRQSAQETWWALSGLGLFFFLGDLALRRFHGQLRA